MRSKKILTVVLALAFIFLARNIILSGFNRQVSVTACDQNKIEPVLNPDTGQNGDIIEVEITITENTQSISAFGLDFTFDPDVFSYTSTAKGGLTADWASVDANEFSAGILIVGGFYGEGTPVALCSEYVLAVVKLEIIATKPVGGDLISINSTQQTQICLDNYVDDIATMTPSPSCANFTVNFQDVVKEDILGTWDGSGVWYRNSETGAWVKMSIPANLVAAGDLDGDNTGDLVGVWPSGLWVKYSSTGTWAKICTPLPSDITSGDMSGDGRDDVLGTWPSGVWYRNSTDGSWTKMATPATQVVAGDVDNDGIDDLIGVWPSGLWVKYSSTGTWAKLCTPLPSDIASGDMNGDGRDDLLGTWSSGVWYRNSMTGTWVKMSIPAQMVACGDLDGDGTEDLIGTWSSGVWVKYSETGTWEKICTPLPSDIDAGLFRSGWGAGAISFEAPIGGGVYAEGPGSIENYVDLSSEGPGGWNFVYQEEESLVTQEKGLKIMMRAPGPGEPGFNYIEQKNLVPREDQSKKKVIKKK